MPPAIFQSNEIVSDIKDSWLSTGYPRNVPETYIHIVFLDHLGYKPVTSSFYSIIFYYFLVLFVCVLFSYVFCLCYLIMFLVCVFFLWSLFLCSLFVFLCCLFVFCAVPVLPNEYKLLWLTVFLPFPCLLSSSRVFHPRGNNAAWSSCPIESEIPVILITFLFVSWCQQAIFASSSWCYLRFVIAAPISV